MSSVRRKCDIKPSVDIIWGLMAMLGQQESSCGLLVTDINPCKHFEILVLSDMSHNEPATAPKLFQPIRVGDLTLKHRVVLAPLTRNRVSADGVPLPLVKKYYAQRASTPGTLLISEANVIAPQAGGYPYMPGIWNPKQIAVWKEVVEAVHAQGSFIFLQLWAIGRAALPDFVRSIAPDSGYVSASDVQHPERDEPPRALSLDEIASYIEAHAAAAKNAVEGAGFDGVEIHGANGYLVDQFIQDVTNKRTDAYGGSIEGRAKFALDVVDAVTKAVGATKTALRLSPWGTWNGMRMSDPKPTFAHLVTRLRDTHPDLAYLHVGEPRFSGIIDRDPSEFVPGESNDFIRELWAPRPLISCGGYTCESALQAAEKGDIIAFGRWFISNPDLPLRIEKGIPFNKYDRPTFYSSGDTTERGYTDYPFANEFTNELQ